MSDGRLSAWIDRTAVDRHGEKIGTIVDAYVDEESGQPEWLAVRTGLMGSSVSFVPLAGAEARGEDVMVGYDNERVKSAPSAEPDGTLSLDEEARLYAHYELHYSTRRSGTGLPEQPVEEEVVVERTVVTAAPRLRRRRPDEDFDMEPLSANDLNIVVKRQSRTGPA